VSHFDRFLSDVTGDATPKAPPGNLTEIDSIVVPSREEGFQETFLKENCWHAIRMHGWMRPQIKYIARYRVAPASGITQVAPVKSIEPWKDTSKFVLNFAEPAKATKPIPMLKQGRVKTFQRTSWAVRSRKPTGPAACCSSTRRRSASSGTRRRIVY
jgi:hypothetical protein